MLAEPAARQARRLLANARRALRRAQARRAAAAGLADAAAGRRRGALRRAVNDLAALLKATGQITAQARQRLAGTMPDGATRRVSLHDGDARPIAKGRLGKPVEFGYKAQVTDNDDGVIVDHTLRAGQPARRARSSPRPSTGSSSGPAAHPGRSPPTAATASSPSTTACRPRGPHAWSSRARANPARPARPSNTGARSAGTVKWRTGSEGRISTLKRGYGWDRTRLDGTEGARIWTGHGVLAHNLIKISALAT